MLLEKAGEGEDLSAGILMK